MRECPDYNTVDAFKLIDLKGSWEVHFDQVFDFLQEQVGAYLEPEDLELCFKRYDKE